MIRSSIALATTGRVTASGTPDTSENTMQKLDTAAVEARPELQQAVQAFVDAGFAGARVRVHDEHGDWTGGAGVSELGGTAEPPANGQAWAGSVTKTFTATLVLQLVAEGRLGLDDPVAGHLPELGLDARITVRMLLQHTSGLYNYTGELGADGAFEMGLPSVGKPWWTTGSTPTTRKSSCGSRWPGRRGSHRGPTRATPTRTTRWPCS
ncbi:serine hydrolase domain-containing protein [Amycolatopsis sp. NPDC003731]